MCKGAFKFHSPLILHTKIMILECFIFIVIISLEGNIIVIINKIKFEKQNYFITPNEI